MQNNIYEAVLYIPIAILYNMFFHKLSPIIFSHDSFVDRYNKTIILLFIMGTLAIVLNRLMIPNNEIVRTGIGLGGLLLIGSGVFNNWNQMKDSIKLLVIGILFVALVSRSYKNLK